MNDNPIGAICYLDVASDAHPRVLEYWREDELKPVGGPAGYLYGLRKALFYAGKKGYEFLPVGSQESSLRKLARRIAPQHLLNRRALDRVLDMPSMKLAAPVDYTQYEAIHFHRTLDLYAQRESLENYDGKVILTSHSPCAPFQEAIEGLNKKDVQAHSRELGGLSQVDSYAFSRADYVIFPCPEAEEPYFHTWDGYAKVRDESKMYYLPTGVEGCAAKVGRAEVRKRYGIPEDAFVACYVGRHNKVKGYDTLAEAAPIILADPNTWVLVAGRPGSVEAPVHPRWAEAGWTDDPHSIIAAADVFVLPNRETYFDLVLLEVLSLGQVVVASWTGGNKYFERFGSEGIRLYEGTEGLLSQIEFVRCSSPEERASWGLQNKQVFAENFTLEQFARGYDDIIRVVLSGER